MPFVADLLRQDFQHVVDRLDAEDLRVAAVGRFQGGTERQDAAPPAGGHRQFRDRQGAGDLAHAPVQPQLPEDEVIAQAAELALPRGLDDAEGDREVIAAAALVEVGRGQVDDDFPAGDVKPLGLEGGDETEQAFLDGRIGQSHEVDAHAAADFNFYQNGNRLDADAFGGMYIDEHNSII